MPNTDAVTLRPRADADVDVLFEIASEMSSWEERGPSSPGPLSRSTFDARLAASDADTGPNVQLVVDVAGKAVGSVQLFGFDQLARHAEIGIALASDARGQGFGTAAVAQIAEFGFERCNLRRIHLEVIASNAGAIRSYEKAGFVIEGRQREHAWVRGHYEDIVRMGLLREEWRSARETERPLP